AGRPIEGERKSKDRGIAIFNRKNHLCNGLTLSHFQEIASKASHLPVKLLRSEWISTFTIHRRCASQMRVGNAFLLGDAAHIHSPVGGQGLNTSVQDAFNLAWKIALVHQGIAPETLLDSYEQERLPIAKAVLESTSQATKVLTSGILKKLLFPLLRPLISTPCVQKKLLTALSEIGIDYKKSPIICTSSRIRGGPKPGMRAPDAHLSYAGRLFQRLHPTSHTLLLFGDDPTLIEKISSEYSGVIDILHLDLQRESEAAKIYGATTSCCYLIRPDGYIAFCAKAPVAPRLLKYLKPLLRTVSERR
ncbi:MAG: FAD-dependent monooxygenase, partial [Chlamydiota bacterium]